MADSTSHTGRNFWCSQGSAASSRPTATQAPSDQRGTNSRKRSSTASASAPSISG